MTATPVCLWCGREFTVRCDGGRAQRFCRSACRRAFHAAARTWVLDAIENGALTVADIKGGPAGTRALLAPESEPVPMGRGGAVRLSLKVLPNVVDDFGRLGWLTNTGRHDDAVADAIVEIVERALTLRLRPSLPASLGARRHRLRAADPG